jgi:uncharacterized membrane protein YesL
MGLFFRDKPRPENQPPPPPAKGVRLFFQILSRELFSLIKLNFLFYLFCIPIVTIPASYCAMTGVVVKMVRDEPYFLWHTFWNTFRLEFKKATIIGFVLIAGLAVFVLAIWYYGNLGDTYPLFLIFAIVAIFGAVMMLFVSFSLFPMISLFDLPLITIAKNAFFLAFLSYLYNFVALAVCVILVLFASMHLQISFIPMLLLYPSLLCLITVFSAYGGIKKHIITN